MRDLANDGFYCQLILLTAVTYFVHTGVKNKAKKVNYDRLPNDEVGNIAILLVSFALLVPIHTLLYFCGAYSQFSVFLTN